MMQQRDRLGRARRLTVLLIGPVLVLTTACGGGESADAPGTDVGGTSQQGAAEPETSVVAAPAPSLMPDYVGRDFTEAKSELSEFNVRVTRQDQIAAEPVGTVIEQSPDAGQDFSQDVALTVAIAPPEVPDVTGASFGDASQQLRRAGFSVVEEPVFDERERDGLVLSQTPAAGTTNAGEVRLRISRRPIVMYLADLEPVEENAGEYAVGTGSTNGEPYTHSVTVGAYGGFGSKTATVAYDLSRDYRRLVGQVGLEDRSVSGTRYKVEIYGDGRNLFTEQVALGEAKPVDLDVTEVLRLTVSATLVEGDGSVVLADLRALGLETEVDATPSPSPSTSGS